PKENFYWSGNSAEAGHVIYGFESVWLPSSLLAKGQQEVLADVLMAASRHWVIELHFQKGLAGAPDGVRQPARDTPVNPAVVDAFALAIIASEGPSEFPGLAGHEPKVTNARHDTARIAQATAVLRAAAQNGGGAYVAESNYFQPDWQSAYWG